MATENNLSEHNLQTLLREEFGRTTIRKVEIPKYFKTALNPKFQLRPYQKECFQYFITYCEQDFEGKESLPHLLFHMATGSGKTLIMAGVILYLFEKGYRNFLFFVNSTNIIEKTKANFFDKTSEKYLFAQDIKIGQKQVEIKMVKNFQNSDPDCINLCLTTTQALHIDLNTPRENSLTYDDFKDFNIVLISDEAHHSNTATKKRKAKKLADSPNLFGLDSFETEDWESTVMQIFKTPNNTEKPNILLEFTATADLRDPNIAQKYHNKIIFDYPLKKFRQDGYSKEIGQVLSDLSPLERAIQAAVVNQYKRKLFSSIGQDIKPVMMLKSYKTKDNLENYTAFASAIQHLNVEVLEKMEANASDEIREIFDFLKEKNISLENFLLELQEDFKKENLLLIDQNNISPQKQIQLNTLESKGNEFRAIFAVNMLNEGWDVLNLFDIVRMYNQRDSRNGKPGKTTMQEAQLIGRGARYMPFFAPNKELPKGERKFDNDTANHLRMLEKLHYHCAQDSRYINELKTALVETGIIDENVKEFTLSLKDKFKQTPLYQKGYVFANKRVKYIINKDITSFEETILTTNYIVKLKSGETSTGLIFEKEATSNIPSQKYFTIKMKELGNNVIRSAINYFDRFRFSQLSHSYPNLTSIKEFIESDSYLANLSVSIYTSKNKLQELSQKEKLQIALDVLKQIEPKISEGGIGHRGSLDFTPRQIKNVFKDHVLKISQNDSDDKEYGKSMLETTNPNLNSDLRLCDWHAYNDCFGTSEEKHLIKYIESIYLKLKEKYEDIYLLRNEKDLKLWSFETGNAFEPDYVMFLRKEGSDNIYDNIQIFIEPKGEHLRTKDAWKESFLNEIKQKASIKFSTKTNNFNIWGMPFFTENKRKSFDEAFQDMLNE